MEVNQKTVEDNLGLVGKIVKGYDCPDHLDKEELFQEGIIGLHDAAKTYKSGKGVKFSTYAYSCARNRINNFVRKNKRLLYLEDLNFEPADEMDEMTEIEERIDLENALRKLQEREQEVINLLFYEDLTLEEAGKRLGVSHMTVARVRDRALCKLKKAV